MNRPTKVFSLFLVFNVLVGDVTALKCLGRPHLKQDESVACLNTLPNGKIDEIQSCIGKAREDIKRTCNVADRCMAANIRLVPGQYASDANKLIWSFTGCYRATMDIKICATEQTLLSTTPPTTVTTTEFNGTTTGVMTTTTAPTTTTTTPPTTTTTTTPTTTTTTPPTTTTTTPPTTTTTTEGTTTTTTPPPTTTPLPTFDGCWEGTVSFTDKACDQAVKTVVLTKVVPTSTTTTVATAPTATVNVQIAGCCNTAECKPLDGQTRPNTCNFGTGTDVSSVLCKSDCFTYYNKMGSNSAVIKHGCLDDIDLSGTSFDGTTSCTSTYEDGSCSKAGNDEECLRCCSTTNCNTFTGSNILKPTTTPAAAAAGVIPSLFLIASAWLICKLH